MTTQTPDPIPDLGHAPYFRLLDLTQMPGRGEAAPEGYEWVSLPGVSGMFGVGPAILMCMRCAAFVAIHQVHTEWHSEASR